MTVIATDPLLDQLIALNGLRFHYRDWPNEGAQTLLLLHGFTGHARSWDTLARAMNDRYRVLALDQRGHGESDWATEYSVESMVSDVDAFVRALGLKQFALLGLSMGGRNAYHYAAKHPAEVERLVIVDIGPEIPTAGSQRIRTGVEAADVFDTAEEALARSRVANPLAPEAELRHRVLNNLMRLADGRCTFRYDKGLRDNSRPLPRPTPGEGWAAVKAVPCPTLLVRGAQSDILAPETARQMVAGIADCRLVEVPRAGHSIPLDNPTGLIEAVRTFL
jgi:pimeloyl-ACP methyl ester carboxylesterase